MKIYIYGFFVLISIIIFVSCGKKLDPKPKDTIIIPSPNNVILENSEEGVYIKNNENYTLFVEKSSIDDARCAENFIFLTKLKPNEEYVDKNVIESHSYIYRFTNIDESIGVESIFRPKSILYSKPIKITGFVIEPKPTGEATIFLEFNEKPRGVAVKINGKDLGRFTDNKLSLLLEDRDSNEIIIVPYDKYNNHGIPKRIVYSNPKVYFLTPPDNLKYVIDENRLLLNWDDVPYAKGYKIYNSSGCIIDTKVNYVNIIFEKCVEIYISSYNDFTESEKRYFKICKH